MKVLFLFIILTIEFFVNAAEVIPVDFCGVHLGQKVPEGFRQVFKQDSYYVYMFQPKEKILKFNQYLCHASLMTKTVIDASGGFSTGSEEEAVRLFNDACRWLERKYPNKELKDEVSPKNWTRKAMSFGDDNNVFFLVEMNRMTPNLYLVMISLRNAKLTLLEEFEAKNVSSFKGSGKDNSLQEKEIEKTGACLDGWTKIEIPGFVSMDIPPTMEVQKGLYKSFKESIGKIVLDVDYTKTKLTIQESGLNDLLNRATNRYARIIVSAELIYDNDEDNELTNDNLTIDFLKELDEMEYKNMQAATRQIGKTGMIKGKIIKWYPVEKVHLGGLWGYRIAYLRQLNDNPYVYVESYRLGKGRYVYNVTFSYRQNEESFWKGDYDLVKRRIKFKVK